MGRDLFFPPGTPLDQLGAIERFMPPIEKGSVTRMLEEMGDESDLIVDPFGASPQLVIEATNAGRALLIAVNNPITRFFIQHTAKPFTRSELQFVLARFSTALKDGSRLETFLKDLYRTMCSRCGAMTSADYYIWDREQDAPFQKGYACAQCGQVIEEATNEVDRGLARSHTRKGLQFAMALEQLAPSGDPYRRHAEAALSVYPSRALYGLITLLSRVNQIGLTADQLAPAHALLLYVFDACNALWGHPEGRIRPRRLSLSPQYIETNVWHALEKGVDAWSSSRAQIPIQQWPKDGLPKAGNVAIYPGPARFLSDHLTKNVPKWILTVLPRPNQAYWTLSALWAAWLWGRDAALPIKVSLRRRRYDWPWHAKALRSVFSKVGMVFDNGSQAIAFLPETEPGFLGAALVGLDDSDFKLIGRALRLADDQAILRWEVDHVTINKVKPTDIEEKMSRIVTQMLNARGEPAPYGLIHAAVFCTLAEERQLCPYGEDEWNAPVTGLGAKLETVLYKRDIFLRVGKATEIERGIFWLVNPSGADEPLSDRIESAVLQLLRDHRQIEATQVLESIYHQFSGLLTPDRRFLENCLNSYATYDSQKEIWFLREEDYPEVRDRDRQEMSSLLARLGTRMGFRVSEDGDQVWSDERGEVEYLFRIQDTAKFGNTLADERASITFVLPGSRASLVMSKVRRDPRLGEWLKSGPRILKFRHVRRLVDEETLTRNNLIQRFTIDPPEHDDPQLPLL